MKYCYHLLKKPLPNREITARARETLRGNWGSAIFISVIIPILLGILQAIIKYPLKYSCGISVPLIILGIVSVVIVISNFYSTLAVPVWFIALQRGDDISAIQAFKIAFSRFWTLFLAGILMGVIIFLKLLLFIIPGIMAAYDYILVYFCIADDPNLSPGQALKRSRAIMHGHRWQFFCFSWRFVGWTILCLLTLGIGFIWLVPYMTASMVEFYRSVMPESNDPEYQELPEAGSTPAYSFGSNLTGFIAVVILNIIFCFIQFFFANYCFTNETCVQTQSTESVTEPAN